MAAFATMAAAEARAKAKVADKTWIVAHAGRTQTGVICVRIQRFLTPASPTTRQHGAWVELTDDGAV